MRILHEGNNTMRRVWLRGNDSQTGLPEMYFCKKTTFFLMQERQHVSRFKITREAEKDLRSSVPTC